jgi:fatty-acyl-CoA synthase
VALNSSDLLSYIYTSGTTGMPKPARISHLRWFAAGLALGAYGLEVTQRDTVYCPLPLYHSNGMLIALGAAMRNGATLALSRRFRASQCWEEVAKFGATRFVYIGEVLRYLVNTPPGPYDRAHKVTHVLGNGLRPDIWRAFQERFGVAHIREFYASTEGNAAMLNLNNVAGSCGASIIRPSNLALVRMNLDTNEYIRGADGFCQRCAPGEIGELLGHIKAATTPFGGYASAEETEKKLLRNVFKKGDVHFKTGDLLKQDADGNFFFIDRIGDTFRWKGENVSTQEVQELVNTFGGIQMTNVFGITVPGAEGRAGMAVLVMNPGAKLDPAAFYRHTQEHLPAYARPAFVRIASDAILTGTFKLKKTELLKEGFDPAAVKDPLFYRDEGKGSYLPLTAPVFKDIQAGKVRF